MKRPSTADTWRHNEMPPQAELLSLAKVIFDDGCHLITPFDTLIDVLPTYEGSYRVEHTQMTQAEYEGLPEFEG